MSNVSRRGHHGPRSFGAHTTRPADLTCRRLPGPEV